jgi:hypothetical protein
MAKRTQGQVNEGTGRVEIRSVRKARRGDFDVANPDTALKRFIRAAIH